MMDIAITKAKEIVVTEEAAQKAAEWWGDKVATLRHHDNGDSGYQSVMMGVIADMSAIPVETGQREAFIEKLKARILEKGEREVYLESDYHPCRILYECAEACGISSNNFPWKTNMIINGNRVLVSDGYGRPFVQI